MAQNEYSLDDPSPMGRMAISVTGIFLLTFFLGFMRFMAGSWREAVALGLAGLGYAAALLLLAHQIRPQTEAQWRRIARLLPLLGAAAGAAYVAVSTAAGVGPVVAGLVWGTLHGLLVAWGAKRRASVIASSAP